MADNFVEYNDKPTLSTEQFLCVKGDIDSYPASFSFQNSEIQYGLSALAKWSDEAGGKETAGVLYVDENNKPTFKDLTLGSEALVEIDMNDFSDRSKKECFDGLVDLNHHVELSDRKRFVLLPPNISDIDMQQSVVRINLKTQEKKDSKRSLVNNPKLVVTRGMGVSGSVHVHPSGRPPNQHDLALTLCMKGKEFTKGVIGGGNLWLMVSSESTQMVEHDPDESGKTAFSREVEAEIDKLILDGVVEKDAMMHVLVTQCRDHSIALYEGKLEENLFKRLC